jgi:hypothetical protein
MDLKCKYAMMARTEKVIVTAKTDFRALVEFFINTAHYLVSQPDIDDLPRRIFYA